METVEERLIELLLRRDELRRGGESVTPEELCTNCPDLLEALKRRIRAMDALARMFAVESASASPQPTVTWPGTPAGATVPSGRFPAGYEIRGVLGHGSMGIVYRALDRGRGEEVALKTILWVVPSTLYRFKREFRALADLTHPHLVKLHELVSDGRDWWIAMELVEGVDFLSYVRPGGGSPPPGRLRDAFRQLAEGVAALHAAGRLHRDLKPSNVRVTDSGRVVVLDFGLAAELDPDGQHRSTECHAVGTFAYMAPEQAEGRSIGSAADWYSVGVMLYEAIAGRRPPAGGRREVLAATRTDDPPPPPADPPGVPEDLKELCLALLERDPAARPTGAEILRRLGAEPSTARDMAAASGGRPHATPMAGRHRQLEALGEAFAAVRRGRAVALFVRGRSGVGKTTLVNRFLDSLPESAAAVVLAGRCREQEWVPYKAVDGLIDALSRHLKLLPEPEARELLPRDAPSLARVFPVLRRVDAVARAPGRSAEVSDPCELRRRAFAAMRELLARLGDRRPLVLFIDDLQWGDIDSAALLAEVLRPPDPPVLLLLGSYRSEDRPSSPFLRALLAAEGAVRGVDCRELELGPLSPAEAEELALELLGREAPGAAAYASTVARESQGSPFFVHELVQHAGRVDRRPAEGVVLDEVLWSRIERLAEGARRLLEVVAVAGRALGSVEASRAAELEAGDRPAMAALRAGRLIRGAGAPEGGQIEVYHDRIREVVVSRLEPATLRGIHRRLAMRLEDSGRADGEVLAVHLHQAGEEERASVYYAAAAERAGASLAFDRAATLFRLALELRPAGSRDEYRLRAKLGDALANARRGREAGQVYLDASPGVSRLESIDLRRRAFQQLLTAGEHDRGIEVLREVFRDVGLRYAKTPSRALAMTIAAALRLAIRGSGVRPRPQEAIDAEEIARLDVGWSAGMGLGLIDTTRAADILFDNLLRGLRSGEVLRATQAMLAVSGLLAVRGSAGLPASRRLMRSAEAWLARRDDPTLLALQCMARGLVAHCQGQWSDSLALNDQGAAIFRERCTGVATSLDISAFFSLLALSWLGDLEELRRRRRALLEEAERRQDLFSMTNYRTEVLAYDLLGAGEPDEAAREVEDAIGRWSRNEFDVQHLFALIANVRIDLYRGMGSSARGRIRDAWRAYRQSCLDRSCIARLNIDQLVACSALAAWAERPGDPALLREASSAAGRLGRERIPYAAAIAAMVRGRIAAIRGDHDRAIASYRRAAGAFRDLQMPLYEAATLARLGGLLPADEGEVLVRETTDRLAVRQIREPMSIIRMILP